MTSKHAGTKIVLLNRGECSFVAKVRNAERGGASLVVVIDDREEDIKHVVMGDDGTGAGIRIPSMLIGKDSGAKLMQAAQTGDQIITLSAEFTLTTTDKVDVEFWYSSNNQFALDFMKDFDKYVHEMSDFINF